MYFATKPFFLFGDFCFYTSKYIGGFIYIAEMLYPPRGEGGLAPSRMGGARRGGGGGGGGKEFGAQCEAQTLCVTILRNDAWDTVSVLCVCVCQ